MVVRAILISCIILALARAACSTAHRGALSLLLITRLRLFLHFSPSDVLNRDVRDAGLALSTGPIKQVLNSSAVPPWALGSHIQSPAFYPVFRPAFDSSSVA